LLGTGAQILDRREPTPIGCADRQRASERSHAAPPHIPTPRITAPAGQRVRHGRCGRVSARAYAAALAASFALGCIPSGRLVAFLFFGRRARHLPEGGLGASAVARQVGAGAGILVFVLDLVKGALPVLWARWAGCSPGRRGLLGWLPLAGNVAINHTRGASTVAGVTLAEDPEALGLVSPVLAGGFLLHRHPQSVLLGYLLVPLARRLLGRGPVATAWTVACMAIVILARLRGAGGVPANRQVLKARLLYDRESHIPAQSLAHPDVAYRPALK
jgi:glycerol-3-phosphate acyltransferase PlsY